MSAEGRRDLAPHGALVRRARTGLDERVASLLAEAGALAGLEERRRDGPRRSRR